MLAPNPMMIIIYRHGSDLSTGAHRRQGKRPAVKKKAALEITGVGPSAPRAEIQARLAVRVEGRDAADSAAMRLGFAFNLAIMSDAHFKRG